MPKLGGVAVAAKMTQVAVDARSAHQRLFGSGRSRSAGRARTAALFAEAVQPNRCHRSFEKCSINSRHLPQVEHGTCTFRQVDAEHSCTLRTFRPVLQTLH